MGEQIEFASNYNDLSTDKGFQFEFNCNRCSNGFRTRFQPWVVGSVSGVLDAAGSLLGGVFSSAADVGQRVRSADWQKAHDDAFAAAAAEMWPSFIQCPRCSQWVCRKSCWNARRGLCKECAPDMGVEMSAAQASRSVEEVWAHARMAEADKRLVEGNWRGTVVASCPNCGAPQATNAKFCPECGMRLNDAQLCSQCGTKLRPGARFCPECGAKGG